MYPFWEWADAHEQEILQQLPYLSIRQQVELDKSLNSGGAQGLFNKQADILAHDNSWKSKVPDIIEGRETNQEVIKQTIDIVKRDIQTHNRIGDGSNEWHQAWIGVYNQWVKLLLGALNGTKSPRNESCQKEISF